MLLSRDKTKKFFSWLNNINYFLQKNIDILYLN
jgi:hypothetical protein